MTLDQDIYRDGCHVVWGLVVALYLYAGHQSWRLVNIVGASEDALQVEFRAGRTPWLLYVGFVAIWPILLCGATVFNIYVHLTKPKE